MEDQRILYPYVKSGELPTYLFQANAPSELEDLLEINLFKSVMARNQFVQVQIVIQSPLGILESWSFKHSSIFVPSAVIFDNPILFWSLLGISSAEISLRLNPFNASLTLVTHLQINSFKKTFKHLITYPVNITSVESSFGNLDCIALHPITIGFMEPLFTLAEPLKDDLLLLH